MSQVDRGGLDYNIQIGGNFASQLPLVRAQLAAVFEQINKNQAAAAGLARSMEVTSVAVRQATVAAKSAATANAINSKQARATAKSVGILESAQRKYAQAVKAAAVSREFARISDRNDFNLQKRLLTQQEQRVLAEKALTSAINKQIAIDSRKQAIAERGVSLTFDQLRALKVLTKEQERLRWASQRTTQAINEANDAAFRSIRVAGQVADIRSRNADRAARQEIFGKEGLDANGNASKATRQLAKEQERLANAARKSALAIKEANDQSLRTIRVAGQVAAIRSRNDDKAARQAIFAAQGLDANGKTIKAPRVPLNPQEIGQAAARKRLDGLIQSNINKQSLEQEVARRGLKLTKDQRRELGLLNNEQERGQRTGRSLLSVLTRIAGTILAFAAIRQVFSVFRNLVVEIVNFNAKVETAQLGIASLLTAVSDVRDATGQTVDSARALGLAQIEARKQTQLLRRDALQTAATFDDLLGAFQTAVAPGFQAGLNVDQIRQFTVQISQAATTIGLETNQLAEEIRSLLQGTIQARQTRIATSLGITNEDIRNAKEAGVLFEFLQERFTAFTVAGEESLKTYRALYTNLVDAFRLLASEAGSELFVEVKRGLADLFRTIVSIDPITGILSPDPQALKGIQGISDGLVRALGEVRKLGEALGFDQLGSAGVAFGNLIADVAVIARGLITGLVQGFTDISTIVQRILGSSIFDNLDVANTVALVTRILTLITTISIVFAPIIGLVTSLGAAIFAISVSVGPIMASLTLIGPVLVAAVVPALVIAGTLALIGAALVGIVEGTRLFNKEIGGVDLTTMQTARIGFTGLRGDINKAQLSVTSFGARVLSVGATIVGKVLSVVIKKLGDVFSALSKASSALDTIAGIRGSSLLTTELAAAAASINDLAKATPVAADRMSFFFKIIADGTNKLRQLVDRKQGIDISNIVADDRSAAKFLGDQLTSLRESLAPEIRKLFDELGGGGVANPDRLSDIFRNLPPIISKVSDGLAEGTARVVELRDASREAADALRETVSTVGLQGAVASQRSALNKSQVETREVLKTLLQEQSAVEVEQLRNAQEKANFDKRLLGVSKENIDLLNDGVVLAKTTLKIDNQIANARTSIALTDVKLREATKQGNTEQIDALIETRRLEELRLEVLREQSAAVDSTTNSLLAGASTKNAQTITLLISQQLSLRGREIDLEDRSASINEDRLRVEGLIFEAVQRRVQASAVEANFDLVRSNAEAIVVLEARRAEIAAASSNEDIRSLVNLQNEVRLLEIQASQAQTLRELEISSLEGVRSQLTDLQAIAVVEQQILLLRQQNATATDLATLNILEQGRIAEEQAIRAGGSLSSQFGLAIEQLERDLPSRFQSIFDILSSSVGSFGDFVTQTIVDAFDPTAKGDISERFGRFLQGIASQIISSLVRVAIARAALNLSGLFGFGDGGEVPQAFSRGGDVQGSTSGRRRRAIGLASGGDVPRSAARPDMRPKGIPASDTVPAFLTPGEFVHRVDAVRTYGLGVMEAINQARIDPTALKDLAAGTRARTTRAKRSKVRSFAEGGSVAPMGSSSSNGGSGSTMSPAYIVASERTMDTLLSGGAPALRRWLASEGFGPRG